MSLVLKGLKEVQNYLDDVMDDCRDQEQHDFNLQTVLAARKLASSSTLKSVTSTKKAYSSLDTLFQPEVCCR